MCLCSSVVTSASKIVEAAGPQQGGSIALRCVLIHNELFDGLSVDAQHDLTQAAAIVRANRAHGLMEESSAVAGRLNMLKRGQHESYAESGSTCMCSLCVCVLFWLVVCACDLLH